MHNGNGHGHGAMAPMIKPEEVQQDAVRLMAVGPRFKKAVLLLGALFILGIVGFAIRLSDGMDDHTKWGYYAALFAFLLSTASGAVLVSLAMRLVKNHWRRPFARAAETYALVGVFTLLVFIPLLFVVPDYVGRATLWNNFNFVGGQRLWDLLSVIGLVVCGLGVLYASALPDMALMRERASGWRQTLSARLSWFWKGTNKQWKVLSWGLTFLAVFYFMTLVTTHTFIGLDFAMSLVPGWRDGIFPTYQALSSLQGGVALVMVTMWLLRKYGGMEKYIGVDQFWSLSKIMLALSLLWAYFWFAGFITYWYGRKPEEQQILKLLIVGPYEKLFYLAFFFSFLIPFLLLIWNAVRKSVNGPALVAAIILMGNLLDKIRIYVAAFSIENPNAKALVATPAAHSPDFADIFIIIGGIAGAILIILIGLKVFSPLSIWEVREGLLYRVVKPFGRTHVTVLGKPD